MVLPHYEQSELALFSELLENRQREYFDFISSLIQEIMSLDLKSSTFRISQYSESPTERSQTKINIPSINTHLFSSSKFYFK
jgi:hypothetical protein